MTCFKATILWMVLTAIPLTSLPGAHAQAPGQIKIYRGNAGTLQILGGSNAKNPAKQKAASKQNGTAGLCPAPSTSSQVISNQETYAYDIGKSQAIKSFQNVASVFKHKRKITYETDMADGCLKKITIIIDFHPQIHLPNFLRKDQTGCEAQSQINKELEFSRETASSYQALGAEIETLAAQAFPLQKVFKHNEATALMDTQIASAGLLNSFDNAQKMRRRKFQARTADVTSFNECTKAGMR